MKNHDQVLADLNLIFQAVFKDASLQITANTTADNIYGWDSLTHMILIDKIEKHFSLEFSFAEVMDFQNVGDMVQTITQKQ